MIWLKRALGAVAGDALMTLAIAALRSAQIEANLALLYLLPVQLCAMNWGWWTALFAALLAFLTYNYLFVEPIHTLAVHSPDIWVELLTFLFVAALTSNLAARERARRVEARQRADEALLLFDVSRALASLPMEQALGRVAELLQAALDLRGCGVLLADERGNLSSLVSHGELPAGSNSQPAEWLLPPPRGNGRPRRWIALRTGRKGGQAAHHVPLRVGQRLVGALRLAAAPGQPGQQALGLLAAVAEQLAGAIEQDRLRRAAEEADALRRTDELRAALLSSVSHDLRTPLATIKASAGSLLQHDVAWSAADRDGFAAAIDREANRLDRLVQNLLDLSRIEGGYLRLRRDWYDLAELIREVVARLAPLLADHPLSLELDEGLPPVRIDYLMIDQVLTNLLENVVRHTPTGTPVEVRLGRDETGLSVAVIDRGPGVAAEAVERLFERFQRGSGRADSSGSGLGLAVSRGFVEAHGGRLELMPANQGASFRFTLPIESVDQAEAETPKPGAGDLIQMTVR